MLRAAIPTTRRCFSVLSSLKNTAPSEPLKEPVTAKAEPLSEAQEAYLDRAVRVDQAGELGADYIYAGQFFVLANKYPHLKPILQHMWDQEIHHHKTFDRWQMENRVRPSLITPLWKLGAFAMGAGTAAISSEAAMACTEAVETVIGGHYNQQLRCLSNQYNLQWTDGIRGPTQELTSLTDTIRQFRDDELEHLNTAIEHDSRKAVPYILLTEGIKGICRAAIWTAERI
ncbi:catabolite repression protein cat5 [Zygosaccharomyces mellis]|uniref:5-demethoxyubiquinone hydroxylase, mitochondrial n=1 Tax=Zygosaccharomyces mellis TaxID=42258 RepID=A0A4C2EG65_9SACH|nr:catabolite repression protein cat5 [Zygosaccharomyces mellis]